MNWEPPGREIHKRQEFVFQAKNMWMYMCGNLDTTHHLSEAQLLICEVGITAETQRVIKGD